MIQYVNVHTYAHIIKYCHIQCLYTWHIRMRSSREIPRFLCRSAGAFETVFHRQATQISRFPRYVSTSVDTINVIKHATGQNSRWRSVGAAGLAASALLYSCLGSSDGDGASCSAPVATAGSFKVGLPMYSKEEVSKHTSKATGIWVTYKDGVYDVSQWVDIHPGGSSRLMLAAGGPIDPFWAMYAQHNTEQVKEILEEYRIGNLEGGAAPVGDPYENEPKDRHPSLLVRSTAPMNAETPLELLSEILLTPNDIFYIRNHLPVPEIDKSKYELRIGGEGLKNLVLDMDTLKKNFKKHTIVATIQCTGNRRKDLMDCT